MIDGKLPRGLKMERFCRVQSTVIHVLPTEVGSRASLFDRNELPSGGTRKPGPHSLIMEWPSRLQAHSVAEKGGQS